MLRRFKDKKAQAVMGEYMLVIFLVLAVIVGMTVYFKRAVQARIHDARDYMVSEVRTRTRGNFNGNLYKEYEPYYSNVTASVMRDVDHATNILAGASSGIFQKTMNETTSARSFSQTAPPNEFDRTTPVN